MTLYQKPYGMHDILPEEQAMWEKLRERFTAIYRSYGFSRIDTPVLEKTPVFLKGVGEGTDIVDKEMYTFEDKGGHSLTLRPEFTAGIVRAYLEHGMKTRPQPVKLASIGSLFRRDRPGAGRYRQFHQVNAEIIGTDDPAADSELLSMAVAYLQEVGIDSVTLLINSTGCPRCKPAYLNDLVAFLSAHRDELDPLDVERIERNPLRVLDSKEEKTQAVLESVPLLKKYLCDECDAHFRSVLALLDEVGITYEQRPRLVRGLDYYTKTVFELVSGKAPETGTLLGGGRYDGLAEILGGAATPAVGFAGGLERLALTMEAGAYSGIAAADVFVAYIGGDTKEVAFSLAGQLRKKGIKTVFGLGNKGLKSQLKMANKTGASICVIVGEGELAEGKVQVRNMKESTQSLVPAASIAAYVQEAVSGEHA